MALPSGYKQVEYIESSGTQYVDTGFKPTYQSRVVADVSGIGTDSTPNFVFGTRSADSNKSAQQFCVGRIKATSMRFDYFGSNQSLTISDASARTTIDANMNKTTMFGSTVTCTAVTSGVCPYTLTLFALNNIGTVGLMGSFRLYSCQIYDSGTLVRDYVPCINESGEIGLYDLVNDQFYANAGSGSFTAGEVVIVAPKGYVFVDGVAKGLAAAYCMIDGEWKALVAVKTIINNYHNITFESLEGLAVTGVWNEAEARLEC